MYKGQLNEEHASLHLPKLKNKPLQLNAVCTWFAAQLTSNYEIDLDAPLKAQDKKISDILLEKEWFSKDAVVFNSKKHKMQLQKPPYIEPDLEDGLEITGETDEYVYLITPFKVDSSIFFEYFGYFKDVDVFKTFDNLILNLALKLFRIGTYKSASQRDMLLWDAAMVTIYQEWLRKLLALLDKAKVNVNVPAELLEPLVFNEECSILFELTLPLESPNTGEKCQFVEFSFYPTNIVQYITSKQYDDMCFDYVNRAQVALDSKL